MKDQKRVKKKVHLMSKSKLRYNFNGLLTKMEISETVCLPEADSDEKSQKLLGTQTFPVCRIASHLYSICKGGASSTSSEAGNYDLRQSAVIQRLKEAASSDKRRNIRRRGEYLPMALARVYYLPLSTAPQPLRRRHCLIYWFFLNLS